MNDRKEPPLWLGRISVSRTRDGWEVRASADHGQERSVPLGFVLAPTSLGAFACAAALLQELERYGGAILRRGQPPVR
jgi:hypothetical protein